MLAMMRLVGWALWPAAGCPDPTAVRGCGRKGCGHEGHGARGVREGAWPGVCQCGVTGRAHRVRAADSGVPRFWRLQLRLGCQHCWVELGQWQMASSLLGARVTGVAGSMFCCSYKDCH